MSTNGNDDNNNNNTIPTKNNYKLETEHNEANGAELKASPPASADNNTMAPAGALGGGGGGGCGGAIEWTRTLILNFIEDYRQHRVLWDQNTKGYHVKQTKYEALSKLSIKYNAEIRSIRSKIKSLRSSFHREHGKVINGINKGVHYQPMWFAYDAISFILDSEAPRRTPPPLQQWQQDLHIKQVVDAVVAGEVGGTECDSNAGSVSGAEEQQTEEKFSILHNNNATADVTAAAAAAAAATVAAATAAVEEKMTKTTASALPTSNSAVNTNGAAAAATTAAIAAATTSTSEKAIKPKIASMKSITNTSHHHNHMLRRNANEADANELQPNSAESMLMTLPTPAAITTAASTPMIPIQIGEQLVALGSSVGGGGGGGGGGGSGSGGDSGCSLPTAATTATTTTAAAMTTIPTNVYAAAAAASAAGIIMDDNNNSIVSRIAAAVAAVAAAATAANNTNMVELTSAMRSDFEAGDFQNYINISADDVKTEIIENENAEPIVLEKPTLSACTSMTAPMAQYYMSNGNGNGNGISLTGGNSRKRKATYPAHVERREDMPTIAKRPAFPQQAQHSNLIAANLAAQTRREHDPSSSPGATNVEELQASTSLSSTSPVFSRASTSSGAAAKIAENHTDEYGVFGEYVAITIRKLHTSKAKIVVKHLINNLLFEAELGNYDQGMPSTKEPPQLYKM